jgi:hypothetical protein
MKNTMKVVVSDFKKPEISVNGASFQSLASLITAGLQ